MNLHSQKLVHHLIASHLRDQQAAIEDARSFEELGLDALDVAFVVLRLKDVTGVGGEFFIDAIDHSTTVGDLVALVDRWWPRGAARPS
jgi:acyl carrier protein